MTLEATGTKADNGKADGDQAQKNDEEEQSGDQLDVSDANTMAADHLFEYDAMLNDTGKYI